MNYQRLFLLCCMFMAAFLPQSSHACTTFCLDTHDDLVVGTNFDLFTGDGLVIVNKRNVAKTSWLNFDWIGEQPISWISKYGSVTFNSWGREFPFYGMNEAGLVVSVMRLSTTIYPVPDSRPAINPLQWVQYQLDTAATVADVIASDLEMRIRDKVGGNFFICDSTGTCATIEFIDGNLICHTQETMPVKVLANSQYSSDLEYWEKQELPPDQVWSTGRFFTAAQMLEDYNPATSGPAIDYTFDILSNLTWFVPTQWSIAYDVQRRRISFRTLDNEDIRYFDMNSFDFSCLTPVKILDVQEDLSGDISGDFINYTFEINRDLIEKIYAGYDLSDDVIDFIAAYPETTECVDACALDIEHKKIRYAKLSKAKKVVLKITGDEDFDIYSQIHPGPLAWSKKFFNRKKNRLKVRAIVPAGLRPGTVPIWVGNCFGEIEVLP
jgi:penicillin V acylase-like amidase (Ntn superfamily)